MMLRCTHCNTALEGDLGARCSTCLRVSGVVESSDVESGAQASDHARKPEAWPMGTSCPLCLVRGVADATFYLSISKKRVGAVSGGTKHNWTHVRCRSCQACRARVVRLQQIRWIALTSMVAFTLAPFALAGFVRGGSFAVLLVASLIGAVAPVAVVFVANRNLRTILEGTPLFARAHASVVDPGAITQESYQVRAGLPAGLAFVNAEELFSGRRQTTSGHSTK